MNHIILYDGSHLLPRAIAVQALQFPEDYKTTQNLVTTTTVYKIHIDVLRNWEIGACMIIKGNIMKPMMCKNINRVHDLSY